MRIRPTITKVLHRIDVPPEYFFNKTERIVLGLLLKGYTFEQITKRYNNITEYGIRSIFDNLYEKLECEEVLEDLNDL